MAGVVDIKKRTEFFIQDLHAREWMRLGWYRQFAKQEEQIRYLRERKARHTAFLHDLLRKRDIGPAWYARPFYLLGHVMGFFSAFFPLAFIQRIEGTLENWMLIRYERYLKEMHLDASLRSMIESVQLKRLNHNEPGPDVMGLLQRFLAEQELALGTLRRH
ncbi:MAG: hypothetical protein SF053_06000 [Bacteroidia bacterium]|nr:hypothetical protein [Bacteroidia bacterium]